MSKLPESVRLAAITAAVKHAKAMRSLGCPVSTYSPAIKEPVHYLWERPNGTGGKGGVATAHSLASETSDEEIVYEHSIPFKFLRDELMELDDPTLESVRAVLSDPRHGHVAMITKSEDALINKRGFASKMPDDWNGNVLARYEACGIKMVAGPLMRDCPCACGKKVGYQSTWSPGHDAIFVREVVAGKRQVRDLEPYPNLRKKYDREENRRQANNGTAAADRIWNDDGVGLVITKPDGTSYVIEADD